MSPRSVFYILPLRHFRLAKQQERREYTNHQGVKDQNNGSNDNRNFDWLGRISISQVLLDRDEKIQQSETQTPNGYVGEDDFHYRGLAAYSGLVPAS